MIYMKNLFAFLTALFILTGCGLNGSSKVVTLQGVVDEQSMTDHQNGTHLLTTEKGEIIPLKSISLNLSNNKYADSVVEIVGKYDKDEVLLVSSVTVLRANEKNADDEGLVDDIYKNTDLGFQIKHPSNWKLVEGAEIQFFSPEFTEKSPDADYFQISMFAFDYNPSFALDGAPTTPLQSFFSRDFLDLGSFDSYLVKIGPDMLDAIKIENADGVSYYMYRNKVIYNLSFIPSKSNSLIENKAVFKAALSSFRFLGFTVTDIESDSTMTDGEFIDDSDGSSNLLKKGFESDYSIDYENYTSFESLPYHFTAIYPSDWYYSGRSNAGNGILHHYGFSTESVTTENEILSLNILSSVVKKGSKLPINTEAYKVSEADGNVGIYVVMRDQGFHISGPAKYEDVLLAIASSIKPITR